MKKEFPKLEGITWDGFCPSCKMQGVTSKMRLNHLDFFECEQCKLQIVLSVLGGLATILNFRGKAKYRRLPDYANELLREEFLSPQTLTSHPFTNKLFKTNEEMEQYITNEITP